MTELNVPFRSVIPLHWTGTTKLPGVLVCGACPTPEACAEANRCARASDEDYEYASGPFGMPEPKR